MKRADNKVRVQPETPENRLSVFADDEQYVVVEIDFAGAIVTYKPSISKEVGFMNSPTHHTWLLSLCELPLNCKPQ